MFYLIVTTVLLTASGANSGAGSVTTSMLATFETEKACARAADQLAQSFANVRRTAICVATGRDEPPRQQQ